MKEIELPVKQDGEKPDLTLVSRAGLVAIAKVKMFGAKKYGRWNYLNEYQSTDFDQRLLAASLRHITADLDGELRDDESGLPHIYHALACLEMLMHRRAKRGEAE